MAHFLVIFEMEGLLAGVLQWLISKVPWKEMLDPVCSRFAVKLCHRLTIMVDSDDDLNEVICETCDLPLEECYEVFDYLNRRDEYHWGHYKVFVDWVKGFDVACNVEQTLRKKYARYVPPVGYLSFAWIRSRCGKRRTPSV